MALSALVMSAWVLDIVALQSLIPGAATMKFNTALGFLISGTMLLTVSGVIGMPKAVNIGLLISLFLLSSLTIIQALSGIQLGIDEFFVLDKATTLNKFMGHYPGQMSLVTGLCFMFLAVHFMDIFIFNSKYKVTAQVFSALVLSLSQIALIGYMFTTFDTYGVAAFSSMAVHTALLMWLISFSQLYYRGIFTVEPLFKKQTKLGRHAFIIILLSLTMPIFIAGLIHIGVINNYYSESFEISLNILFSTIVLFIVAVSYLPKFYKDHLNLHSDKQKLSEKLEVQQMQIKINKSTLEHTEKTLLSITESLNEAIVSVDHDYNIVFWNSAAEKIFGHKMLEVIGRPLSMLFSTDCPGKKQIHVIVKKMMAKQSSQDYMELEGLRATGESFPIDLSISTWESNGKKYASIVARDITLKKQSEAKIAEQSQLILQSVKMKSLGEMAGSIAHEVNTPLGTINLMAAQIDRYIKNGDLEKATIKAGDIENVVDRISQIIKGLKNFSRNDESDPLELLSIAEVLDDTLPLIKDKFSSSSVKIKSNSSLGNVFIKAKRVQCSQVVLNLLSNSYHAVKDLEERWVEVAADIKDGFVDISITDSGSGIPDEIAAKILKPFFTTKPMGEGTGLGLSITKGIIENMGGQLTLDKECQNTRFVIRLPRVDSEPIKNRAV